MNHSELKAAGAIVHALYFDEPAPAAALRLARKALAEPPIGAGFGAIIESLGGRLAVALAAPHRPRAGLHAACCRAWRHDLSRALDRRRPQRRSSRRPGRRWDPRQLELAL